MSDALTIKISAGLTPAGQASFAPTGGDLQDDLSIDEHAAMVVEAEAGAGRIVDASYLTTGAFVIVKHRDPAMEVTITWGSGLITNTQKIPPGRSIQIPNFNPLIAIVLVADSGTPLCTVLLGGAETS